MAAIAGRVVVYVHYDGSTKSVDLSVNSPLFGIGTLSEAAKDKFKATDLKDAKGLLQFTYLDPSINEEVDLDKENFDSVILREIRRFTVKPKPKPKDAAAGAGSGGGGGGKKDAPKAADKPASGCGCDAPVESKRGISGAMTTETRGWGDECVKEWIGHYVVPDVVTGSMVLETQVSQVEQEEVIEVVVKDACKPVLGCWHINAIPVKEPKEGTPDFGAGETLWGIVCIQRDSSLPCITAGPASSPGAPSAKPSPERDYDSDTRQRAQDETTTTVWFGKCAKYFSGCVFVCGNYYERWAWKRTKDALASMEVDTCMKHPLLHSPGVTREAIYYAVGVLRTFRAPGRKLTLLVSKGVKEQLPMVDPHMRFAGVQIIQMPTGTELMKYFNECNNGEDRIAGVLLHTTC